MEKKALSFFNIVDKFDILVLHKKETVRRRFPCCGSNLLCIRVLHEKREIIFMKRGIGLTTVMVEIPTNPLQITFT